MAGTVACGAVARRSLGDGPVDPRTGSSNVGFAERGRPGGGSLRGSGSPRPGLAVALERMGVLERRPAFTDRRTAPRRRSGSDPSFLRLLGARRFRRGRLALARQVGVVGRRTLRRVESSSKRLDPPAPGFAALAPNRERGRPPVVERRTGGLVLFRGGPLSTGGGEGPWDTSWPLRPWFSSTRWPWCPAAR